ncbi:MAG TPA: metal-sulfur cluster assembly factor [Pseudoneobacillus sp.]|nr:metal-sulfur cluster assembly factor [Pseudoneobacillus sp.]
MEIIEKVRHELKNVFDPELNINVVDLGLIYNIKEISDRIIEIDMTLTTPGCPLHDSISSGVKHCVEHMKEVDQVYVNIVWEPAWSPDMMTEEGKKLLR